MRYQPTKIVFGDGVLSQLPDCVDSLGCTRPLIVCGRKSMREHGVIDRVEELLRGLDLSIFDSVEENPSVETADACAEVVRSSGRDIVIGLGGGSALDVARAAAMLAANPGSVVDYLEGRAIEASILPLLAIPTTAGTGSEVTAWSVLTWTRRKQSIRPPDGWAKIALVDPELTHTMPPALTASTGMDAFSHAIEAYWNKNAQPISDLLALEAMSLVFGSLRIACAEPRDHEAREKMALASLLAGLAFSQTLTAAVHTVSYPLTTRFGVAHGAACSILIPPFVMYNSEVMGKRLGRLLEIADSDPADGFARAIEGLAADCGLPTRLGEIGVGEADLAVIIRESFSANIKNNPRELAPESLRGILQSVL
jgi:phosphonate metabolism-associated iron-containing alcohol dehydrogenase